MGRPFDRAPLVGAAHGTMGVGVGPLPLASGSRRAGLGMVERGGWRMDLAGRRRRDSPRRDFGLSPRGGETRMKTFRTVARSSFPGFESPST